MMVAVAPGGLLSTRAALVRSSTHELRTVIRRIQQVRLEGLDVRSIAEHPDDKDAP